VADADSTGGHLAVPQSATGMILTLGTTLLAARRNRRRARAKHPGSGIQQVASVR
jgi:hypothetical protein